MNTNQGRRRAKASSSQGHTHARRRLASIKPNRTPKPAAVLPAVPAVRTGTQPASLRNRVVVPADTASLNKHNPSPAPVVYVVKKTKPRPIIVTKTPNVTLRKEPEPPVEVVSALGDPFSVNSWFRENTGEDLFVKFIAIQRESNLESMQEEIQQELINNLWIDSQTSSVVVKFIVYNGNLQMFANVQVDFSFELGGKVVGEMTVAVLDLEMNGFVTKQTPDYILMAFEVLLIVCIFALVLSEMADARGTIHVSGWLEYFGDFWNLVDVMNITTYVACCGIYGGVFLRSSQVKIASVYDWSPLEEQVKLLEIIDAIEACDNLMQTYMAVSVCNLLVILVRLFKFMRLQPKLAVVNNTFSNAYEPLLHFFVIFGIVLIMFTIMGMIVFGRNIEDYSSFDGAFNQLFLLLLGDFDYGEIRDQGGQSGVVFFYVFVLFSTFILLNFFLAIVMSAYDDANDAVTDDDHSLPEDIVGAYRSFRIKTSWKFRCSKKPPLTTQDIVRENNAAVIQALYVVHSRVEAQHKEELLMKQEDTDGEVDENVLVITVDRLQNLLSECDWDKFDNLEEGTTKEDVVQALVRFIEDRKMSVAPIQDMDGDGEKDTMEEEITAINRRMQRMEGFMMQVSEHMEAAKTRDESSRARRSRSRPRHYPSKS